MPFDDVLPAFVGQRYPIAPTIGNLFQEVILTPLRLEYPIIGLLYSPSPAHWAESSGRSASPLSD